MESFSRFLLFANAFLVFTTFALATVKAEILTLDRELKSLGAKISSFKSQTRKESVASNRGDWIGRFVVDENSIENCVLEIENIKAQFAGQVMTVSFDNGGTRKQLDFTINDKNSFSEWVSLTFDYLEHNRFLDRDFNLRGIVGGNILTGTFYAGITRIGDSCSGDMYFVKKGTLEAQAYQENRDPRSVRLEHRLALLQKVQQANPQKKTQNQDTLLENAVEELMRFRTLQRKEQSRLEELKKQSAAQAKELAALKKVRIEAVKAQRKRDSVLRKSQHEKKLAAQLRIEKDFGMYHALVIGIDKYKNLPRLKTALADANAIAKILGQDYGFKVVKLLNPSRDDILNSIDDLRSKLTFNDNLLIYYSGHGQLDREADEGYWLPVNAKPNRRSRWLSNNTLSSALRALAAKHVMVVADSCYSGRLTRGISVRPRASYNLDLLKKLARKKARVVLTSGGLNPVDDDNGSGHSPFADALLKALKENKGIFNGASLFKSVYRPVQLDTRNQEPQYSDLRRAGHDGGDFIFVKQSTSGH